MAHKQLKLDQELSPQTQPTRGKVPSAAVLELEVKKKEIATSIVPKVSLVALLNVGVNHAKISKKFQRFFVENECCVCKANPLSKSVTKESCVTHNSTFELAVFSSSERQRALAPRKLTNSVLGSRK